MLAVIGLLLTCTAIVLFECVRVLKDLPGAPAWLDGVAKSNTGIIVIMALFVTGISVVARFALDIESHAFGPIEVGEALAIVIATAVVLRILHARRQRALTALATAGDGAVAPLAPAHAPAPAAGGDPTISGVSRPGSGNGTKNAA